MMGLAPRHPAIPRPSTGLLGASSEINPNTGQKRDSGLGKEGKARQRERNKDSDTKHLTNSGSSGKAKGIAQLPKVDFDAILPLTTHLVDIAGKITHTQVGGTGWCAASLAVPIEYIHDIMVAHVASQQTGLIFLRVYYVPMDDYMTGVESNGDEPAEDQ